MNITIKIIRNVAVSNLMVLGLAACSSSPAPWTQVDDSPWGSKRMAEVENLPEDIVATADPVMITDPEIPVIVMEEPAPVVVEVQPEVAAPIMTESVMVESTVTEPVMSSGQSVEQEILGLSASDFAVQVFAGNTIESVERFKNATGVYELKTVTTIRSGSIVYILVDIYSDRDSAYAAATDLASRAGVKPWVRSLAGIQKIIAQ